MCVQVPIAVVPEPIVRRQLRALAAAAVCDALAGSWAGQAVVFSHQAQVCFRLACRHGPGADALLIHTCRWPTGRAVHTEQTAPLEL